MPDPFDPEVEKHKAEAREAAHSTWGLVTVLVVAMMCVTAIWIVALATGHTHVL